MTPLTLLVPQTVAGLLTGEDGLTAEISVVQASLGYELPGISSSQVILSSADSDIADRRQQISYPRVAVFASRLLNNRQEKFRTLSGNIQVTIAISASADLVEQVELWLHYYVEAITNILRRNAGDWGSGIFFPGTYEVQLQAPKAGGSGFVQSANVFCNVCVSRS
jgi:hypothetical protein